MAGREDAVDDDDDDGGGRDVTGAPRAGGVERCFGSPREIHEVGSDVVARDDGGADAVDESLLRPGKPAVAVAVAVVVAVLATVSSAAA